MNKLLILSTFLLLSVVGLNAQTVYSVEYESQADVKVFVVEYESQADLLVFKENYSSRAKGNEGNWFFVDYKSQADKSIYFVEYESKAGWRSKDKVQLMY